LQIVIAKATALKKKQRQRERERNEKERMVHTHMEINLDKKLNSSRTELCTWSLRLFLLPLAYFLFQLNATIFH